MCYMLYAKRFTGIRVFIRERPQENHIYIYCQHSATLCDTQNPRLHSGQGLCKGLRLKIETRIKQETEVIAFR